MKYTTAIMTTSLYLLKHASAFTSPALKHASKTTVARIPLATFATRATAPPTVETTDQLQETFNDQVTRELSASQLYLSASIWAEQHEFTGMAKYFRSESEEERGHALAFVDFANKRQIPLQLQDIAAPASQWSSPSDLWEHLLKAEEDNTAWLRELGQIAEDESDVSLKTFLDPFHMEQVNSEDSLRTILTKVRDMENSGIIHQLDSELGQEAA